MEFPKNFFKKECRCNFEISPMMKRAWAAQMEVLQIVGEICEKHDLQYFADWGTLLGAIRHKGFIPWDDDIDICLKRNDYMKLINVLPSELPKGFVLAGMYSPSKRLQNAAYVPHLRVIADEEQWNFNDYMIKFHGFPYQRVGIDIFPLDTISNNRQELTMQSNLIKRGVILLRDWDLLQEHGKLEQSIREYESRCNIIIPQNVDMKNWLWRFLDAIAALYTNTESDEIINGDTWISDNLCILKKEWYDEMVYVPFENIKIPVPVAYDNVLKTQYGDYMTCKQGTAGHDYPFYRHMEGELLKQIRAVGFKGDIEEFCEQVSTTKLRV